MPDKIIWFAVSFWKKLLFVEKMDSYNWLTSVIYHAKPYVYL